MREYFDRVYNKGKKNFYTFLEDKMKKNEKTFVVTANPETLMIANDNDKFKKCLLDDNTIIVPDGIGVLKGANMLGYKIPETITGVELCTELFEYGNKHKKSIYLFGAKPEVVELLAKKIKIDYPNLKVLGYENGYVEDKQKVFDEIEKLSPDLVLVALGIPAQELLINKNFEKFNKGIFIGVGGSFDVLSGTKKRAPKFFIKFHLEWLYRITTEPKRMKRFLDSNVKYLFKLSEEK